MTIWKKLVRFFVRRPVRGPARNAQQEIEDLVRNIARTADRMSDMESDFYQQSPGSYCCAHCDIPGYSELFAKQERRRVRLKQLQEKLASATLKKQKHSVPEGTV